jgi:CRP-like cAMP-binding protein
MARTGEKPREDRTGNRILDALPAADFEPIGRVLERVELGLRDYIYRRGEPIEYVHFPINCVISLVTEMEDGRAVEIATVGCEGMVGIPVFLQAAYTSAHESFSQVPGASWRMRAEAFTALANQGGLLQALLQRYTQALFSQISQSSACNRLHTIEQRCARWLLQTHDRVTADKFPLTQEFLAQMLGVQRSSVNGAAGALQDQGVIRYSRGVITVLDRQGLEDAACECYRIIANEFARLIP